MPLPKRVYCALLLCAAIGFSGCIKRRLTSLPPMYINLFSGIRSVAFLGERDTQIDARKWRKKEISLSEYPDAKKIGIDRIVELPDIGVRIFFKRRLVTLIEIQDPFPGYLLGRSDPLFTFSLAPKDSWRDSLIRQLGKPSQVATGGRLGSHSLFYRWGDISFNRMGPNQVAIYRIPEIVQYRENNFGRVVKFFSKN